LPPRVTPLLLHEREQAWRSSRRQKCCRPSHRCLSKPDAVSWGSEHYRIVSVIVTAYSPPSSVRKGMTRS
jgi:hypothetical protein